MNHSSFPKIGESPTDQELRVVMRHQEHGRADQAAVDEKIDEITTVVVAQQSRAFLDIVTDGMVRWNGPHSYLAENLNGVSTGKLFRWYSENFYDRRTRVEGPISAKGIQLVRDYQVARDVALSKPVKVVLPGPVTWARMAEDSHYGSVDALADACAEILVAEAAALAEAGAEYFQIDEPCLCEHPGDLDRVSRTAKKIFDAAGEGATTILSTYYGDLNELGDHVNKLPGTHVGLDLITHGDANFEVLQRLSADRGVSLGVFNASSTRFEDATDVCARLEPYRSILESRDVFVGPNAGLEPLPQDAAFDKLLHARYIVEQLTKEWT